MPTVHLRRGRAKPFFFGHPWVFSGSVQRVDGKPADGDVVHVVDDRGQFVAKGLYNGHSQIRVRLLSWNPDEVVDEAFFANRVRLAVALRNDVLRLPEHTDAYRVVHSEGDGLPGVVVDRYGDWLVLQILSLGMAHRRDLILEALRQHCPGLAVFERSDTDVADKEGIEPHVGSHADGEPPERVPVTMHGVRFDVDVRAGQKTGLFLDQRDNWRAVLPYAAGRRMLDCFAYAGAFSIFAKAQGAVGETIAIDLSDHALALARHNAELNAVDDITFLKGNVFGELRRLRAEEQAFGLIVLDPPKFARSHADVEKALRGYKDINLVAMQCLEPGGILVTCSCSQHVDGATFDAMLNAAAIDIGRDVQVLETRGQGPDHPVTVACPETRYLKCRICRVL